MLVAFHSVIKLMTHQNKGRILRVKTGYNPNSSSVGSQIPVFLTFAAGSGILTIIILHVFNAVDKHIRNKRDASHTPSSLPQEDAAHLPEENS